MKLYDDQYIVITGAAGLIGSGVVRYLNDKGFTNLILVDDFGTSEKWKNLVGKKYTDFISRYDLMEWLEGKESQIEAFVHLGACSDTTETDGDYIMENNYRFSTMLAEYAIAHNHRFIYASSAATYGMGSQGFLDHDSKIDDLRPLNLYGYSKQIFDQWLLRQNALDKVVGLKYFNVYGPNENHKERMASMAYHMTPLIQKEKKVKLFASSEPDIYKDGEQCRDFIYVKDAVKLTCSFLENDLCGIYNIGTGEPRTWNDLAKAVFVALETDPNIEYIPMPEDLIGKYQNYTSADITKIKKDFTSKKLKFPKFTSLEDGVKDYVQNHLLKGESW